MKKTGNFLKKVEVFRACGRGDGGRGLPRRCAPRNDRVGEQGVRPYNDNPSVTAFGRDTSLYTREALKGGGGAGGHFWSSK